MSNDCSQQLAKEFHKLITRTFLKRTVISNSVDEIWAADLVEMQKFSKWNKGIKCLLMAIDVFSKYGWIEPLKNKKMKVLVKHLMIYLKQINVHQKCFGQIKVLSLSVNILYQIFESSYITLKMKKNQVLLRDGIKQ